MNVDIEELAHFAALSEHWWNPHGPLRTLHDINPTRMDFIKKHVDLAQKRVLDVGCGGGILSEALAKVGAYVTAIDQESRAIAVAKAHAEKNKLDIDYQCIAVEDIEAESALFDIIICMELLEHVPDPATMIQACAKLLKPNGTLFLSTINRTWKAYAFAIVGVEYILDLVPKNTHTYDRFIKPSEAAAWLKKADLTINALSGLQYNPCTHQAHLDDDVTVNYLMAAKQLSEN